jgi:hypothetical protein
LRRWIVAATVVTLVVELVVPLSWLARQVSTKVVVASGAPFMGAHMLRLFCGVRDMLSASGISER